MRVFLISITGAALFLLVILYSQISVAAAAPALAKKLIYAQPHALVKKRSAVATSASTAATLPALERILPQSTVKPAQAIAGEKVAGQQNAGRAVVFAAIRIDLDQRFVGRTTFGSCALRVRTFTSQRLGVLKPTAVLVNALRHIS
ncbi:MAG: hypothetical protein ABUJ98_15175 [Hyphomicrobium sp.]